MPIETMLKAEQEMVLQTEPQAKPQAEFQAALMQKRSRFSADSLKKHTIQLADGLFGHFENPDDGLSFIQSVRADASQDVIRSLKPAKSNYFIMALQAESDDFISWRKVEVSDDEQETPHCRGQGVVQPAAPELSALEQIRATIMRLERLE